MKKNIMMRLASGLLVATLLSTCAISGTFAKYVTEGSATDSARVAKWGVKVQPGGGMFKSAYAADAEDAATLNIENSVVAYNGTDKLVAPGTSGSLAAFTITGTPEVAVRVTAKVTEFDLGSNWVASDGNYYCPLVITVNGVDYNGLTYTSADAFEDEVKDAINGYVKTYPANAVLDNTDANQLSVSWKWPFSTSDNNDVKDTDLGNQAVAGNAATVEIEVALTVTQID